MSTNQANSTHNVLNKMPDLHSSQVFRNSPTFKEFLGVYKGLGTTAQHCLLCFAVFPSNEVIKKMVLVHWWMGEGFLDPPPHGGEKNVYEIADDIFDELTKKNCIERVKKKLRFVNSYKIHPLIRSAVIVIAEREKFLQFDKGNPTVEFLESHRACLMEGASDLRKKDKSIKKPEKLYTIINVDGQCPEFSGWSDLRNLKVLCLGRWHNRVNHNIKASHQLIKGLSYLKNLIFLSLRGVSGITELPDSMCKLVNLKILDLSSCHDLEILPERIGLVKKLMHLDISECYYLDHMPRGISSLSELQVLKGFLIGEPHKNDKSCTLRDLSGLKKLTKLTINTSREGFPTEADLKEFQKLEQLRMLTIAWGWVSTRDPSIKLPKNEDAHAGDHKSLKKMPSTESTGSTHHSSKGKGSTVNEFTGFLGLGKLDFQLCPLKRMPSTESTGSTHHSSKGKGSTVGEFTGLPGLEKLDLQLYPLKTAPSWLVPAKLTGLKKLNIRGGELRNLRGVQDKAESRNAGEVQEEAESRNAGEVQEKIPWTTVEMLRLRFLSGLKMDWEELHVLFPKLIYLEKYRCPKLTFFPCNENGAWLKAS